jgi:hypothetical protein
MMGTRSSFRRRNPLTSRAWLGSSSAVLKRVAVIATLALGGFATPAAFANGTVPCAAKPPETLVSSLRKQAPGLKAEVLRLALNASDCAAKNGLVKKRELLTVIDYSLPSTEPRLWVFDVNSKRLLFNELVAHGKNSGGYLTQFFSNRPGSLATSLGLFVTDSPYIGSNGYSLRLRGLDKGFNDRAWERAIVMHGASYVSNVTARALGRLGRSWGCPAVRPQVARKMIDTLKGGSPIFAYYPDSQWLGSSVFLR